MTMVDFYVGDREAFKLIAEAGSAQIARVICDSPGIAATARSLNLPVLSGDAARLDFEPSTIGVSMYYAFRLPASLLDRYDAVYNIHPSLLPYAGGPDPIFWTLWEQWPFGVTLHRMTPQLDAGPIVDQIPIAYRECDSPNDLWSLAHEKEREIFRRHWPAISQGVPLEAREQPETRHYRSRLDYMKIVRRMMRAEHRSRITVEEFLRYARATGRAEIDVDGRRFVVNMLPARMREKVVFT